MNPIVNYFHDIKTYVVRDYHDYQKFVQEYPYMKRIIKYASIFGISFFWLVCLDALQAAAYCGLVIGLIGGANPYFVLDKTPPPYKKLTHTKPEKTKTTPTPLWPTSISIVIDRRTRLQRIQDNINARNTTSKDHMENLYEALRSMKNHDAILLSALKKSRRSILCYKRTGVIQLELLLANNKQNQQLRNQAIQLIRSKNIYPGLQFLSIPLCPTSYYYTNRHSIVVMCKNDHLLAAKTSLDLLAQIYNWNGKTKLNYSVGTSDTSWWNKW